VTSRWPTHHAVSPPPWRADKMPGGYVVRDANGQALAYLYSLDSEADARQAKTLTNDEARRGVRAPERRDAVFRRPRPR
jgi:hypothetical protein